MLCGWGCSFHFFALSLFSRIVVKVSRFEGVRFKDLVFNDGCSAQYGLMEH